MVDKERPGKKNISLPSILFAKWKCDVADKQDSLLSKYSDRPLVITLTDLLNSQDQPWEKQSSLLKQAVKILRTGGNKSDDANNADNKQRQLLLRDLVEPMAALGYFYATENNTRRLFIPLLEASSQQLNTVGTVSTTLITVYTNYLSSTDETTDDDSYNSSFYAHKSSTINMTLEFELGRRLISEAYDLTFRFLVKHSLASQKLLNGQASKGTTTVLSVDDLILNIHFLIKTTMSLLTRCDATEQVLGNTLHDSTTVDTSPYVPLIGELTQVLLDITIRPLVYGKDCCQVATMALGAVMNLGKDATFVRNWIMGWFFVDDAPPSAAAELMSTVFGIARPLDTEHFAANAGWKGKDAPCCSLSVPFESDRSVSPLESHGGFKNLHELFFVGAEYFCIMDNGDSQSKVIAFDAMATWLLELKNMMMANEQENKGAFESASILSSENADKLIHYVWNYWDDPIDSLQHRVRSIFELLLAILDIKAAYFKQEEEHRAYLLNLLKNLLMMDWHRKVKYALMTMLVVKLGTDVFFEMETDLVWKCLRAMDSLSLSSQIGGFILELLYQRILETVPDSKPSKGRHIKLTVKDEDTEVLANRWIELWAVPMLRCLTSSSDILRQNASGFILQPLFKTSVDSFWYLMDILNDTTHNTWDSLNQRYRLHAFISILKIARSLDIVDGTMYTRDDEQTTNSRKVSTQTLKLAVYHLDPQIRIDAFGLLCESRKGAAVVTEIELEMIKYFLPLNMNCDSPEFRQKLCAHLTKLLTRLRGNLYAQHRMHLSHTAFLDKSTKQQRSKDDIDVTEAELEGVNRTIQRGKDFLYWLNDHIATSLYPGASFQRVATALRILNLLISLYGIPESSPDSSSTDSGEDDSSSAGKKATTIGIHGASSDFPFTIPLASPRNSKLLVDTLMDSYDFNRNMAFDILCQFPSPLPGITSKENAQELLWWGLNNVVSARAGESDSGAMIFRLVFTKYVVGLEFNLHPQQKGESGPVKKKGANKKKQKGSAAVVFTDRLLDMLEQQIGIAKSNLLLAAQNHPMHGTLLALQYVFRELDYRSAYVTSDQDKWKHIHARALSLIQAVCDSVMDVLTNQSPEGNVPATFKEMEEAIDDLVGEESDNMDLVSGPKHQIILSCCWRAVKEASSLLEVVIAKTPIAKNAKDKNALLTFTDLEKSGGLLRSLLTSIRHRGAFSAVYPTYVSLCARLLSSPHPELNSLPHEWLKENLSSLTSSNISITRRSAGLPLCILAIVSSEPVTKKELLGRTFQQLLSLAGEEPPTDADQRIDLPQVHAYNIMRTIFMDSKLGTRVLEYASDGFSLAINGFSSSSWAIRNCAVMLFSTLLQRTLGTKKTRDEHSNVNNLTGQEFFTRFPKLHSYLLKELEKAVEQLLGKSMAESVHPGLYPMLTLLSRLRPSVMDTATDALSMSPFIPLVMSCAGSSIFKTREMAARALVPLIPSTSSLVEMLGGLLDWGKGLTQNDIHGRLMQVQFLLRGHLYQGETSESTALELIKSLSGVLTHCLTLVNQLDEVSRSLLLDIIAEFCLDCKWMYEGDRSAHVVEELLSISDEAFEGLRGFVLSYASQAIQNKDEAEHIGTYLARQSMGNIIILGYLNLGVGELPDVLYLLDDRDYEVRLLAMTKLMSHFSKVDDADALPGVTSLQFKLIQKTYDGEDNIHCFALAAKFLMNLKKSQPYPKTRTQGDPSMEFTLDQYWDRLLEHFTKKQSILITESVLPLLGALLAQILQSPLNNDWVQNCLKTWSSFVIKYSNKEVSLPLREAVVKSISFTAKHLFMHTIQLGEAADRARTFVELAIIQLLQDDDADIRYNMAAIISEALQLKSPAHPERTVELVNQHLTSRIAYPAHLQTSLTEHLIGHGKLRKPQHLQRRNGGYPMGGRGFGSAALSSTQRISRILQQQSIFVMDVANQLIDFCRLLEPVSGSLTMQRGPYGITSRPTLFLAAYRLLLVLTFSYDYLGALPDLAPDFIPVTENLQSALRNVNESSVHPLLWQQLHGESGLAAKIHGFLRLFNKPSYNMFLIAPDFRE
ncbi:putative death-receptor fusion protein-domain-containing protein [Absidia repens]|uniref:Putative death-receptor fusion protein-domain-containing protein n=1 Tax=Absidia repens TaxID=90262 RepID=A0A1X2IST4_9FUNG|nr:putative death-receptor fusion protein-domain-containing protein [Absidia repens]